MCILLASIVQLYHNAQCKKHAIRFIVFQNWAQVLCYREREDEGMAGYGNLKKGVHLEDPGVDSSKKLKLFISV
jgi:hypothetical protein